jgi:hypothetical protein
MRTWRNGTSPPCTKDCTDPGQISIPTLAFLWRRGGVFVFKIHSALKIEMAPANLTATGEVAKKWKHIF